MRQDRGEPLPVETEREALVGHQKQGARTAIGDASDGTRQHRPAVFPMERREAAVLVAGQLPRELRHPERPCGIDEQPDHLVVLQSGGPRIEHREPDTIEPDQSAEGAEPEVAVRRLRQQGDRVVRQALLRLPDIDRVAVGRNRDRAEDGAGGEDDGHAKERRPPDHGEEALPGRDRPAEMSRRGPQTFLAKAGFCCRKRT